MFGLGQNTRGKPSLPHRKLFLRCSIFFFQNALEAIACHSFRSQHLSFDMLLETGFWQTVQWKGMLGQMVWGEFSRSPRPLVWEEEKNLPWGDAFLPVCKVLNKCFENKKILFEGHIKSKQYIWRKKIKHSMCMSLGNNETEMYFHWKLFVFPYVLLCCLFNSPVARRLHMFSFNRFFFLFCMSKVIFCFWHFTWRGRKGGRGWYDTPRWPWFESNGGKSDILRKSRRKGGKLQEVQNLKCRDITKEVLSVWLEKNHLPFLSSWLLCAVTRQMTDFTH